MKSIYLTAGQVSDVFNELKNILNGTLTLEGNEYTLALNSGFAKGKIQGTTFDDGMVFMQFDIVFFSDAILSMETLHNSPIFFAYCSEGFLKHSFGMQGNKKSIEKNNSAVLKSNSKVNGVLHFEKNIPVQLSVIGIGTKKIANASNPILIKKLRNTFFKEKSNYLRIESQNSEIIQKLNELNMIPKKGIVQNLHKKNILEMILELEIKQNTDTFTMISDVIYTSTLKQIDEIKRMTTLVINFPVQLFTTEFLMPKIGAITNKWQEGFKFMFNGALNDFLNFIRIEKQGI